jgi:hypothetical protein
VCIFELSKYNALIFCKSDLHRPFVTYNGELLALLANGDYLKNEPTTGR